MVAEDGSYRIYRLQIWVNGHWDFLNVDSFNMPPCMKSSSKCWQDTQVYGTFDPVAALDALNRISFKYPGFKFRLVLMEITQQTVPLAEMEIQQTLADEIGKKD